MACMLPADQCNCATCNGGEKAPEGVYGGTFCGCPCHQKYKDMEGFTTRQLAIELYSFIKLRDIPNTIVASLKIMLTRYIDTGEWVTAEDTMCKETLNPRLTTMRMSEEIDRLSREVEELKHDNGRLLSNLNNYVNKYTKC